MDAGSDAIPSRYGGSGKVQAVAVFRQRNFPNYQRSKSSGDLCQVASSHRPAGTAATVVSPESFLFVRFFAFRRLHGLREGQRQRVAVVGRGLSTLLHVGFRFQHQQVAPPGPRDPSPSFHPSRSRLQEPVLHLRGGDNRYQARRTLSHRPMASALGLRPLRNMRAALLFAFALLILLPAGIAEGAARKSHPYRTRH
jgi:hypothetical protein